MTGPVAGTTGGVCLVNNTCDVGLVCVLQNGSAVCEPASTDAAADALGSDGMPDVVEAGADDSGDAGDMPPSCRPGGPGMTTCGAGGTGTESCCTTLPVTGGTFYRSYDGVTYTNMSYPASVTSFDLDRYEVTLGRFRQFIGAVVGGWTPAAGSGKHTHLHGGLGLAIGGGNYESGWDPSWTSSIPTTTSAWNTALSASSCGGPSGADWTPSPGSGENSPLNCITWYEAYAFCIWDGGFLPSETEWHYAAEGGGDAAGQRVYPWSSPSTSATVDCFHANYSGCTSAPIAVGSDSPLGDGRFGQADLGGNENEFVLDWAGTYFSPCADCAILTQPSGVTTRGLLGGGFSFNTTLMVASYRGADTPSFRASGDGIRCARP